MKAVAGTIFNVCVGRWNFWCSLYLLNPLTDDNFWLRCAVKYLRGNWGIEQGVWTGKQRRSGKMARAEAAQN
jgi:hypothetical protein